MYTRYDVHEVRLNAHTGTWLSMANADVMRVPDYTCGCPAGSPLRLACNRSMHVQTGLDLPPMRQSMDGASVTKAAHFHRGDTIDLSLEAPPSFTIVHAPQLLRLMRGAARKIRRNVSTMYELHDQLVQVALPHLRIGRLPVNDRNLRFYGCTDVAQGSPFPGGHWDTDHAMFPGAIGFQLWYLVRAHREPRMGNMFLLTPPPQLRAAHMAHPLRLEVLKDEVLALKHNAENPEPIVARFPGSLADAGFQIRYLDMVAGDLLIFHKAQMHMSDPRPSLRGIRNSRRAIAGRYLVASPGASVIPFNPSHAYLQGGSPSAGHRGRGAHFVSPIGQFAYPDPAKPGQHLLEVTRYEMMGGAAGEKAQAQPIHDRRRRGLGRVPSRQPN